MAQIEMQNGKPVLVDEWHIEDVMSVADCMDVDITLEQAVQVLHNVADAFNVNNGIKWHDIEVAIENVKEK
jgi:hypothetical protein